MYFKKIRLYIYKKFNLRIRDFLFFILVGYVFFSFRNSLIESVLKLYGANIEINSKIYHKPFEIENLKEENKKLRNLLDLKEKTEKKFIIGTIVTNLYKNSEIYVKIDSALISESVFVNQPVWIEQNSQPVLIGFVSEVNPKSDFIKIHLLSKKDFSFIVHDLNFSDILLKGNGFGTEIVAKNIAILQKEISENISEIQSSILSSDENEKIELYYKNEYKVGYYLKNKIYLHDLSKAHFVCIEV